MGLGPLHAIGSADARTRALECRRLLLDGIDPRDAKNKERAADMTATAKAMTFDECAGAYIEAHPGWKNEKHGDQWKNTLATYAGPVFGSLPVADVDTGVVMEVLEPEGTSRAAFPRRTCARQGCTRRGRRLSVLLARQTDKPLLKRMGLDALTGHGFRNCFRDWAGETTNFPREVIEAALAH
ncbi:phage integrase [Caballeronia catudaia]|uniref:Phage integrase n=2 Tax=Caballeronia catudaia TaxID=1777136 RepID=A0A158CQU9_9BURK|nr:phage integrase [Caballeronia catudaia]